MKRYIGIMVVILILEMLFGSVTICNAMQMVTDGENFYNVGDANGDENVDVRDLVAIKKYTVGVRSDICFVAADIDNDGDVKADDIILIKKMLLGVLTDSEEDSVWSEKY